jgi:pyruvate dehydrogenase E2 component (dihydrolipoamide acetyltransferase)
MPKPGQMTEECTLTLWLKREGDLVAKGDVLFEIETDKSTMEVESFHDGALLRRLVAEGETVPVNAICAWVGAPGEEVPADEGQVPAGPVRAPEPSAAPLERPTDAPIVPVGDAAVAQMPPAHRFAISPRASRLAAEVGLDVRSVRGTGPDGRIVERDIEAAIIARGDPAGAQAPATAAAPAAPMAPGALVAEEAPRPLSRMRRVIAERLTLSATTIPHFTITVAVDVTRLLALRDELKAVGTYLTVTDFVAAAAAQSLVEFPDVNSLTDGKLVWPRRHVQLGLAVAVPAGLVVPVIHDADRLGLTELHDRAAALAAAARAGTLAVDDMTGSTFTISNLGMLGVEEFRAIINPGESAILAVGAARATPVVLGDGIAVRTIMKMTLSADHRLVDGELGARFLNAVRRRLEDPEAFRRELANG